MEETLFDSLGIPVAYISHDDDDTIYLWNGTPVAYLAENHTIYGFNGEHLGWFEYGIIRNLQGEKAGFTRDTLTVYARYEPYKSYKKYKPYKSYKKYAKYKPYYKYNNSSERLSELLSKGRNL